MKKEEKFKRFEECLRDMYFTSTKNDSFCDAKSYIIAYGVSPRIIQSLIMLGIVRKEGSKKDAKYFWVGDKPNSKMIGSIINHVNNIQYEYYTKKEERVYAQKVICLMKDGNYLHFDNVYEKTLVIKNFVDQLGLGLEQAREITRFVFKLLK